MKKEHLKNDDDGCGGGHSNSQLEQQRDDDVDDDDEHQSSFMKDGSSHTHSTTTTSATSEDEIVTEDDSTELKDIEKGEFESGDQLAGNDDARTPTTAGCCINETINVEKELGEDHEDGSNNTNGELIVIKDCATPEETTTLNDTESNGNNEPHDTAAGAGAADAGDEMESESYLVLPRCHVQCRRLSKSSSSSSPPSSEEAKQQQQQQLQNLVVPNCCAICLESYRVGEKVAWSTNVSCSHAFHRSCIVEYLVTMKDGNGTPCPICRQPFTTLNINNHNNNNETV